MVAVDEENLCVWRIKDCFKDSVDFFSDSRCMLVVRVKVSRAYKLHHDQGKE